MKKFNKQILEAVSRGIQLALDDYQDIEPTNSISRYNDVIDSEDVIKQRIELDKYTVDLGLPSGTRWFKFNIGCNFDSLNKHPEDTKPEDWYGDYYQWGDIKPIKVNFKTKKCNPSCDWDSYKYAVNNKNNLTKYCNDPKYGYNGYTDNLTQLLPEDDIAYQTFQKYNFNIHMPNKEQFEELTTNTRWKYWDNGYIVNGKLIKGLCGWEFISKNNNNKLFIPMAGFCDGSSLQQAGHHANIWLSDLDSDNPNFAWYMFFYPWIHDMSSINRYSGFSVRPVVNLFLHNK